MPKTQGKESRKTKLKANIIDKTKKHRDNGNYDRKEMQASYVENRRQKPIWKGQIPKKALRSKDVKKRKPICNY